MSQPKDYYAVMGLDRHATDKEIKTAYRKLARKYHPDVNKAADSEEKFKELGQAYDVLRDPEKRKAYDQYGAHWQQPPHQQQPHYQYTANEQEIPLDEDFLSSLFGHHRRRTAPTSGEDYHANITLTLEEAFHGTTKQITLNAKTLNVKIPAGVKEGHKIRLAGLGAPGFNQGKSGDLYLNIHLHQHPLYEIKGNDLYLTVPITPWEAALGASIKVPTLGGVVDLKIPKQSQGGQKMRLKGRGLPGQNPGDQFVLLKIMIPPTHNEHTEKLYEQMAAAMPFNPRSAMGV